jgi:hypothetical protein
MAIPMPANASMDFYRTCNPANPLPGGPPATPSVKGYLQPRIQTGRHGTALYLKWTHISYCNVGTDVRDSYNGQLNGWTNANADTAVLTDTVNATKTAFIVVYVERAMQGTPQDHLRIYLDRFQPQKWPSQAL